ncbi:alanine--tRNA ligase-related protein, partial [Streptomyces brasiliscabiei]
MQSCIRTDDIDLVGDGSHLTYFEMIGCFSFGNNDYLSCCRMWSEILSELQIPVTHITVHPSRIDHYQIWRDLGYTVVND